MTYDRQVFSHLYSITCTNNNLICCLWTSEKQNLNCQQNKSKSIKQRKQIKLVDIEHWSVKCSNSLDWWTNWSVTFFCPEHYCVWWRTQAQSSHSLLERSNYPPSWRRSTETSACPTFHTQVMVWFSSQGAGRGCHTQTLTADSIYKQLCQAAVHRKQWYKNYSEPL